MAIPPDAQDPLEDSTTKAALQETDQRLRLAIEAVQMATWEWHILTDQVYWNEQHFRLFGMIPHNGPLSSEAFVSHIDPQDRPYVTDLLTKAVEQQTLFDAEFRFIREDGVERWMSGHGRVIEQQQGRSVRMSGVMFDIKDRKVAQESLRHANRQKDEFLAMLAHELRNPLSTVRNGLAILSLTNESDAATVQTGTASPVAASTVAMMNRQVDHLVRMVDDLLDVSRISQGKIELKQERLELGPLVTAVIDVMRPQYELRQKTLHYSAWPATLLISADATRLTQAITNLLTNGLRYTAEKGRVWLSVKEHNQQAVLEVADNGIGLSADQLSSIFELFVQADTSLARSQGGLGVGLTLARRLIELQGGRIEVRSPGLGQGSTFVVYLPLLEEAKQPNPTALLQDTSAVRPRILVIDDNLDSALTLSMFLRLKGYEVHSCHSGQEGLQAAEAVRPTVILCDIGMPGLDGYQTARLIREQPWSQTVVLLAVTGYGQAGDKQRAQEAGFDAHVMKPVNLEELLDLLDSGKANP